MARSALAGSTLARSTLIGSTLGAQAGGIITWPDGDLKEPKMSQNENSRGFSLETHGTAPTLLTGTIQNGDHDLSSRRDGDFGPVIRVGANRIAKVGTKLRFRQFAGTLGQGGQGRRTYSRRKVR